jgi:hypothetical protein
MIFIGGADTLLSMITLRQPRNPFVAFAPIEIVGAPLFIWCQFKIVRLPGKTRKARFQLN